MWVDASGALLVGRVPSCLYRWLRSRGGVHVSGARELADRLSRREVLVSAAVVAVAAGLAAEGENGPATPKTQALRRAAAKPTPPPSPKPVPASSRPTPGAPVMNTPVFTLAEYRGVVPGPAYPAHAVALTIDD